MCVLMINIWKKHIANNKTNNTGVRKKEVAKRKERMKFNASQSLVAQNDVGKTKKKNILGTFRH